MKNQSSRLAAIGILVLAVSVLPGCAGKKGGASEVTVDQTSVGDSPVISTLVPDPPGGGGDANVTDTAPAG